MMKRILSLLLAILMIVSVGAFAAETSDGAFPDVSGEHTNSEAIKHYAQAGVINGYEDGTFRPDDPITRAEFVKMLMVMHGSENANTEGVKTGFPDVDGAEGKEAHWAHPHIKTAVDLKIINGYEDGTFRPDNNVKYEEAIKMMVCYLGKESVAKDRADAANIALYPEGYIRVANENLMNINLSSALGENASRADVAQILYNSKDIPRTNQTQTNTGSGSGTIIVPSIGGGGGGGGFGGGGGGGAAVTYTLDESISMGRNWIGSRDGVVVAASKIDTNGRKQQYFIEGDGTGLTTREGLRDTISAYQLIVKMDVPVAGCNYVLFTNENRDATYYNFLGHHVSVNFIYNGDNDAFNIRAISSLQENDTIGSIESGIILKAKTDAYNADAAQTGNYGIVYYNSRTDRELTLKLPLDLNNLKVIYNERLVNTTANPLTISDFIPDNGKISYVKSDRSTYKLIRIEDVDTYVAGTIITSVPRGINDKYRKDTDGTTPLRLTLNDNDNNIDLTIKSSTGNELTVASIRKGNILEVASSKCGTRINVTVHTSTLNNQKIVGISDEEGIAFEANRTKYYPYSAYYKAYVKNGLDIELTDRVTACLNAAGEITWLEETEPVYTIGYLKNAYVDTTQEPNVIKVDVITGGSTPILRNYNITNTTKVGTPSVSGETYVAGTKVKYTDMNALLDVIKAQAAIINSGKSGYSYNATVAQPIRYVSNGSNIELLETVALDADNKFTGTALTYSAGANGKFSGENVQFSASSDATYIFVPNDRSWAANIYKMGTASQVSSKLINYGKYNVEPYFVPNANGGFARKVFVIYNENIDAQPNYRSETIVVERKQQTLSGGTSVYTIYPKSGYGNSKTTYVTTSLSDINAYVLDSNFQRMTDEHGAYVRREVMPGDVIRFGYAPGGAIMNIEILFDISAHLESRKAIAYDNRGNTIDLAEVEYEEPYYYGRTGLITLIPNNPEFCKLSVGVGQTSDVFVGANYASQRVLLNTYDEGDMTSTFESKTMGDLNVGDMIYVWQYYSGGLNFKYIYAVRYETDLMGLYDAENTPTPDPGTGGEPADPGAGGGQTPGQEAGGGTSSEPDTGNTEQGTDNDASSGTNDGTPDGDTTDSGSGNE